MDNYKIGATEFLLTIGAVNIIPLILTLPTFTAIEYGTGAMMHTVYILIFDAITIYILFSLFFKLEGMNLLDVSEYVGGSLLKIITCILSVMYLLTSAIIVIAEFNQNIRNILFENAIEDYINVIFLIGLIIRCFKRY